jgi:hypothetical protein
MSHVSNYRDQYQEFQLHLNVLYKYPLAVLHADWIQGCSEEFSRLARELSCQLISGV